MDAFVYNDVIAGIWARGGAGVDWKELTQARRVFDSLRHCEGFCLVICKITRLVEK